MYRVFSYPKPAGLIFLLSAFLIAASCHSQNTDSLIQNSISSGINDIKLDLTKELKDQLIPLDSLIKIAIINNPGIKAQDALIEAGQEGVKLGRREWQNGVFLSFNQSLGNQSLFYNANNEPVGTQSQSQSTGYRLALNVNIPLYWFSARNSRINISKNELEVRRQTSEKIKLDIASQVVFEYNNMLASHNVLLVSSNAKGTSKMLVDMAEKQFRQGDISIADYSGILAIASKSESDYEIGKGNFYNWYQQLEKLIAIRLDTLVRKK
jgi:outer membrane protein TolC